MQIRAYLHGDGMLANRSNRIYITTFMRFWFHRREIQWPLII